MNSASRSPSDGEQRRELALVIDRRARADVEVDAELVRDHVRERGLAEARRAREQEVVERPAALLRGAHRDLRFSIRSRWPMYSSKLRGRSAACQRAARRAARPRRPRGRRRGSPPARRRCASCAPWSTSACSAAPAAADSRSSRSGGTGSSTTALLDLGRLPAHADERASRPRRAAGGAGRRCRAPRRRAAATGAQRRRSRPTPSSSLGALVVQLDDEQLRRLLADALDPRQARRRPRSRSAPRCRAGSTPDRIAIAVRRPDVLHRDQEIEQRALLRVDEPEQRDLVLASRA